jgi:hypothetical protein
MPKSLKKPVKAVASSKGPATDAPNAFDRNATSELAYRKREMEGRRDGEADSAWFWAEHQAGVPFS